MHTLIPLEDFKAILGLDDREDALSRYCLTTAAYTIEQYCKRRLFLKKHFERIDFHGDLFLPLGEYPVREILAVYALGDFAGPGELLEPDLYRIVSDSETDTGEGPEDMPYSLSLSPALNRGRIWQRCSPNLRGRHCGERECMLFDLIQKSLNCD
ncbi:MAG: hypothetical protein LBE89_02870 [Helicobacteraceae bacterium]|nr:hypothetical protein [Helicobacteraceae bacterium]